MNKICSPSNFLSPIALVGAGTTSIDFFNSYQNSNLDIQLVVDSNPDLVGSLFCDSNLQISELSCLTSFKGEILILCAGNYKLLHDLEELGILEVNFFYNYDVNRSFFKNWENYSPSIDNLIANLQDSLSVDSLRAIIKAATQGSYSEAFALTDPRPYFSSQTLPIRRGDVLLDLGSYRGNHLRTLTQYDLANLERILCVEPNSKNNSYLAGLFEDEPSKRELWLAKLEVINAAIKEKTGLGTNSDFGISNRVDSNLAHLPTMVSNNAVSLMTLNDFLPFRPSLITCDIEGDELNLIYGGLKLLKELRPTLAISTYHKVSHLQSIFEYFQDFQNTSFRFRLHDYGFMDQVLYVYFD